MPLEAKRLRIGMRPVGRAMLLSVLTFLGLGFVATRLLTARAERDHPPLGRWVEVEGLRQHVLERGTETSSPPLVFVHGAFGALQDFAVTVMDEAAQRHRCVAWDRPGHGYSERPAGVVDPGVQARILLGVVRELGLERPLLVGFSYGGAVVLAAALQAPEAVGGVVLLNGPTHPWPDPLELQYRLPAVPLLGRLLTETLLEPIGTLAASESVANAFAPHPVPAAFGGSPVPLALRPASYRANAEDMRELKPFLRRQSERYGELAVPVWMVVSSGDRVVSPVLHAPQLKAAAPELTLVEIPDAGHQILYTHPAVVLGTIERASR